MNVRGCLPLFCLCVGHVMDLQPVWGHETYAETHKVGGTHVQSKTMQKEFSAFCLE